MAHPLAGDRPQKVGPGAMRDQGVGEASDLGGRARHRKRRISPLNVVEGGTHTLTLHLESSFGFSGVVLNRQGRPVSAAQVRIYGDRGEMVDVFTGEDGQFMATQLRSRTGFGWARHAVEGNARFDYAYDASGSAARVVLDTSGPVNGSVFDEKRSAIPGAEVSVTFEDDAGHALPWQWNGLTGKDGSFSVPNCDSRWIMTMIASAKGYRRAAVTCRTTDTADLLLREKISDSRVFGRIVDLAGAPIHGTRVGLSSIVESNSPVCYTGRNGDFSFLAVPRGRFDIVVEGANHARSAFRGYDAVGGAVDLGDLSVEDGGSVSVRVVALGEGGCSAALASLIDSEGNTCAKFLVADGLGDSGKVPSGEYSLAVTAKGYATSAVRVSVRAAHEVSAEVLLTPGELVQIAAYPPEEMPEHVRVRFTLFSGTDEVASFSSRRHSIRPLYTTQFGVGPGEYWVEAEGEGWRGRERLHLNSLAPVDGAKTLKIQLHADGDR